MVQPKQIVCPACARRFSSKQSLAQHRRDAHAAAPAARRKRASQGGSSRLSSAGVTPFGAAPVATPSIVRGDQQDLASLAGVDRILHVEDISKLSGGSIVLDRIIEPAAFARLKMLASSFQKIRYLRLRFEIQPQISTATSGGYVAAFVRDPADSVVTLDGLTSQRGSVTTKWWQSTLIDVPVQDREYYTSESSEIREYSPGRIIIMVDGRASQPGALTVFCHWSVQLKHASLERGADIEKEFLFINDAFTKPTQAGLWTKDGKSDIGLLIEGAMPGDRYKLLYPISMPDSASVTRLYWYLWARDQTSLIPGKEGPEDVDDKLPTEVLFAPKGTVVRLMSRVRGEVRGPSSFGSPMMGASEFSMSDFLGLKPLLQSLLSQLSQRSAEFDPTLPTSQDESALKGSSSSTVFHQSSQPARSRCSSTASSSCEMVNVVDLNGG